MGNWFLTEATPELDGMRQCITDLNELVYTKAMASQQTEVQTLTSMFDATFADEWSTISSSFVFQLKMEKVGIQLTQGMEWFPLYAPDLELFLPIFDMNTIKATRRQSTDLDADNDLEKGQCDMYQPVEKRFFSILNLVLSDDYQPETHYHAMLLLYLIIMCC